MTFIKYFFIFALLFQVQALKSQTYQFLDLSPGNNSSDPFNFIEFEDLLVFTAQNSDSGIELWKTDGSKENTFLIKDIKEGPTSSFPYDFKKCNGYLFFIADDGVNGSELWRTDGTITGTILLKNISLSNLNNPNFLTASGKTLYFIANDDIHGNELWKSDGTPEGTIMVKDISTTNPSEISTLTPFTNGIYFYANGGTGQNGLWRSDGSAEGTYLVKRINLISPMTSFLGGIFIHNKLIFVGNDGIHGFELWESDGTEVGTQIIADINPSGDSYPGNFTIFQNNLYFKADRGSNQILFSYNVSTNTINEIFESDSDLNNFTIVGNDLFFTKYNYLIGTDLYKSNGFSNGTQIVTKLSNSYMPYFDLSGFTSINNKLYFRMNTQELGRELWTSDGTSEGTKLLSDIFPGPGSAFVDNLYKFKNQLFFAATSDNFGREIWVHNEPSLIITKNDICKGETIPIEGNCPNNSSLFWINESIYSSNLNSLPHSSSFIQITNPGKYGAFCYGETTGTSDTLFFQIDMATNCNESFFWVLPKDTIVCNGSTVLLKSSNCSGTVSWFDGFNTMFGQNLNIAVTQDKVYFVNCSNGGQTITKISIAKEQQNIDRDILIGNKEFFSEKYLNANSKIGQLNISPTPKVNFYSGKSILLLPGFEVERFSKFKAEIRICN